MKRDKVALVTGGSKGLGKAIVKNFINNNYKVAFTYLNSEEKANEICKEFGSNVVAIKADACDYNRAFEVVNKIEKTFGSIDILVNNVGMAKDRPIWKITEEDWKFGIDNTLNSCFNYTRAVVNIFIKQNKGKIINIGSINGLRGREGSVSYCSAKSAVVGFTKTIAKELGQYNINANVIAPGYISTDGQENTSELIKKLVLDECAIRKLTTSEEVANVVEFLASDKSNNITGQVIQVDYGQYI
ncbi:SDR family oxidoreductase [Clostridium sporogenes]|uniref:SDR family oxidoreductase n=1 Tax=Clostridium sporogenes TaxID=1509 RepID=A0AAE4FK82_CLOSG|nr:SDR family oxidoreductase [Clostridium sporogenes]MDS1002892.1 SDR family oxidoreductase [Clostridium sporogenes]